MVVRFVVDWSVKQHLVHLEFLQKSMNGDELARELSVMRDWASVNTAAMGIVSVVYPAALNIGCMSHALDSIDKFNVPTLHLFFTPWISLFVHSPRVKALWKGRTG